MFFYLQMPIKIFISLTKKKKKDAQKMKNLFNYKNIIYLVYQ